MIRPGMVLALSLALLVPGRGVGPEAASGDPAALDLVQRMVEAHGGMEVWASAPTVSFRETWYQDDPAEGNSSRVVVEQGNRRAYLVSDNGASAVWNGEKAWGVEWVAPMPPRFVVALTYYFLNLPWLVLDPGVVLGPPAQAWLPGNPNEYVSVRVTYEEGVGDTPDDYYELYIDPKTYRLEGCEYIVTYAALLPPGVEHTPPHLLLYEEFETVDGLVVPTRFTIYEGDEVYARCAIGDWSFSEPFDESLMVMPAGAVPDTTDPSGD